MSEIKVRNLSNEVDKLSFREVRWIVHYLSGTGKLDLNHSQIKYTEGYYYNELKDHLKKTFDWVDILNKIVLEKNKYCLNADTLRWVTEDILASIFIIDIFYTNHPNQLKKRLTTAQQIFYEAEYLIDRFLPMLVNEQTEIVIDDFTEVGIKIYALNILEQRYREFLTLIESTNKIDPNNKDFLYWLYHYQPKKMRAITYLDYIQPLPNDYECLYGWIIFSIWKTYRVTLDQTIKNYVGNSNLMGDKNSPLPPSLSDSNQINKKQAYSNAEIMVFMKRVDNAWKKKRGRKKTKASSHPINLSNRDMKRLEDLARIINQTPKQTITNIFKLFYENPELAGHIPRPRARPPKHLPALKGQIGALTKAK